MSTNHDELCERLVRENIDMVVPWFLMACYAYDKLDTPIISDACFDKMGKLLQEKHLELHHRHMHLIFNIHEPSWHPSSIYVDWDNLPSIVVGATRALIRKL